MKGLQRLSLVAIGLVCVAVIFQPFLSTGVWIGLIVAAFVCMVIGMVLARDYWTEAEEAFALYDRWRAQWERCHGND